MLFVPLESVSLRSYRFGVPGAQSFFVLRFTTSVFCHGPVVVSDPTDLPSMNASALSDRSLSKPFSFAVMKTREFSGSGTTEIFSTNVEPTASSHTGCQMPVVRV